MEADLKDRPVLTVSECLHRRRIDWLGPRHVLCEDLWPHLHKLCVRCCARYRPRWGRLRQGVPAQVSKCRCHQAFSVCSSAPSPSEQAPRDAHSVRMCGVSRGSYLLRRGCACGSGDGSAVSVRESAAKASDRAPRQRHAPFGAPRHGLASPPRATLRAGRARPRRVPAAWRWGLCGRGGGGEWDALYGKR